MICQVVSMKPLGDEQAVEKDKYQAWKQKSVMQEIVNSDAVAQDKVAIGKTVTKLEKTKRKYTLSLVQLVQTALR